MKNAPDLEFFCLVARKRSLSLAARELSISPSAASKRLAQLEQRLGVQLLNRTTRRVNLTQQGEMYFERASRIVGDISELERLVASSRAEPRGLLRVNATFTFGRAYIAPAISEFVKRHSAVEMQLQLTDRPMNLSDEGYDIGIRFGEPPDGRMIARSIARNRRLLCASPAYLKRAGVPRLPSELVRHNCIVIRQDEAVYGSLRLASGRRTETVKIRGSLSTNDPEVALAWALDGHGIVVRSEWDLRKHLLAGRLREVLPGFSPPSADILAVYPLRHRMSPTVRLFVDYLVTRLADVAR
jgi:DNA-binding transcriptional LysR family regulator